MKKKLFILGTLVISVYAMTACGGKQETPAPTPEAVQEAVEEAEAVQETVEETVQEAAEATEPETLLEDFVGEMDLSGSWDDEVSKRASMDVTKNEDGSYKQSGRSTGNMTLFPVCFLMMTATTRSTLLTTKETRPFPAKRRQAALS